MPATRKSIGRITMEEDQEKIFLTLEKKAAPASVEQARAPTTKVVVDLAVFLDSPRLREFKNLQIFRNKVSQVINKIQQKLHLGHVTKEGDRVVKTEFGQRKGYWNDDAQAELVTWLTTHGLLALEDERSSHPPAVLDEPSSSAGGGSITPQPEQQSSSDKQSDSDSDSISLGSACDDDEEGKDSSSEGGGASDAAEVSAPNDRGGESAYDPNERIAELEAENELLRGQKRALKDENDRLEDANNKLTDRVIELEELLEAAKKQRTGDD